MKGTYVATVLIDGPPVRHQQQINSLSECRGR